MILTVQGSIMFKTCGEKKYQVPCSKYQVIAAEGGVSDFASEDNRGTDSISIWYKATVHRGRSQVL
jgi:hypothetical protein